VRPIVFAFSSLAIIELTFLAFPSRKAVRKTKFFLHPDKLPKDLSTEQTFVCKMLWDIVADAWEAFGGD
jgi:hypothetical protein